MLRVMGVEDPPRRSPCAHRGARRTARPQAAHLETRPTSQRWWARTTALGRTVWPLPYCVPRQKIAASVPTRKKHILADLVPGLPETYRFGAGEERHYYDMYRDSYFALTWRRGGWDCLRHYEILAAGCIPFFVDLDECPARTLASYPKRLVAAAARELLPWREKHAPRYFRYLRRLLTYTREQLTCDSLAEYFLSRFARLRGVRQPRILMLTGHRDVNYSRELLAIGLRQRCGARFVEVPKLEVLYKTCANPGAAYGCGFTYSALLDDDPAIDRSDVAKRIARREFDLVVYGRVGPNETAMGSLPRLPLWRRVQASYDTDRIAFVYGGDAAHGLARRDDPSTEHLLDHRRFGTCFVRELRDEP
jgi:hypothetical protein